MFGYTVKEAVFERAHLQVTLQCLMGKRIEIFDFRDIKKSPEMYAKWRTLDKIISIYLDSITLDKFIYKG